MAAARRAVGRARRKQALWARGVTGVFTCILI
jgi:hypothetical protein